MKKIFAMLMLASMIAITSCSPSTTEGTEVTVDSTATVVDSTSASSLPTVSVTVADTCK